MTVRLQDEQHQALETLADVQGQPISELVRTAIDDLIERARQDPDFQKRREAAIERHRDLLERLARA
jgi:predicted transcriptional regulator